MLITGTTSGVGRALLDRYATSGAEVVSVNRRRVPELEALYPSVRFECADVRAEDQVSRLVSELARSASLPDVWLLNAGINRVDNDETFDLAAYREVLVTNLYGALNFVHAIMPLPAGRAARHVVAISSMANYVGNPYGLGYHTSKRALTACFDTWSRMYAGTELVFQQVMLGPVETPMYTMAERLPPWMVWIKTAFSVSPEATARAVSRFARTRRRKLFYPLRAVPLFLAMWLLRALIPGFFQGTKTLEGKARRRVSR